MQRAWRMHCAQSASGSNAGHHHRGPSAAPKHMALLRAHVPGASSAAVRAVFASVVKYGAVDLYLICWGKYARMADLYLYLICIWPCVWYLGVSIVAVM